ncbi:uncharacterized protein BDR25DRAFT_57925 [Lindgomyces ingoldianus]|uniref:Uncharacterized protein n=1 Tax=Lindgomyces ingoldianus TaxID=673940 RepID=A0ACB6QPB7_9PLEO|nr:uncharacterized protein BDR25DRAFT_57925 [Lindgomyces ingoldianus]KAF2468132.1 hypothetical protein BDR25DRAFT_57925 [Lindgomyces ingoldianus]
MPRTLYLVTYPGGFSNISHGKVPAHWALFIPSLTNSRIGKTFDAVGTPFSGYGLRFRRNYNLDDEPRKFELVPIVDVEDNLVVDTPGDGMMSEDVEPKDRLEMEAKRVDPPGCSPRPLDPFGGRNCQSWLHDYITWLVDRNLANKSALEALANAPKL